MEGFTYVDIFATKGIEYLLVIGFLLAVVPFWRILRVPARTGIEAVRKAMASVAQWFSLPEGLFYHQGHSWLMPQGAELVKVGVDDFAQKVDTAKNQESILLLLQRGQNNLFAAVTVK
jgi:glycine cleavage system H protein